MLKILKGRINARNRAVANLMALKAPYSSTFDWSTPKLIHMILRSCLTRPDTLQTLIKSTITIFKILKCNKIIKINISSYQSALVRPAIIFSFPTPDWTVNMTVLSYLASQIFYNSLQSSSSSTGSLRSVFKVPSSWISETNFS